MQWDDYFIHQTGDTLDTVANKSESFMDRTWFGGHGPDGRTDIAAGLGAYPNVSSHGVIDGSFCVQGYDDRHGLDRGPLLIEGETGDFNRNNTLATLRRDRSSDDDRWHFDIQDRLVELTLNGAKAVGLVNNVCGPREGWVYNPTLN